MSKYENKNYRGLENQHEVRADFGRRDTRRMGEKVYDRFSNSRSIAGLLIFFYALALVIPVLFWLFIPVFFIIPWVSLSNKKYRRLPLRMPRGARIKLDLNDPKPQHRGLHEPDGTFMLGNEKFSEYEIWERNGRMLTHWMVVGTTGSGKTVTLLSMVANSLAMASGVIYNDAKASPDLEWQIATMARKFGRDDDFLVTNYITGTSGTQEIDPTRRSNTENPYANASADSLVQILSSLMSSSTGDNQVFSDKAVACASAVLYGLVDLRNKGELKLGINIFREHIALDKIIELKDNDKLSPQSKNMLLQYLKTALSGYADGKPASEQPEECHKQHGYAQSYFTKALSLLTDTYGHIFFTEMGEVDKVDVVLNRRIAVTMLPPLQKSTDALEMLGKINFASQRDSLSIGLGDISEGSKVEALDNLPTASGVPTLNINDELAYQMADNIAVTAAQARGLGVCMVFAMQDFAGPSKKNEFEFQQLVSNTTNKLIMRIDDPENTWTQIQKLAGEGLSSDIQHMDRNSGNLSLGYSYQDNPTASLQRRARIDLMDLKAQVEGEGLLMTGDQIIRMNTFTALLPIMPNLRINRFVCVGEPVDSDYPEKRAVLESAIASFVATVDIDPLENELEGKTSNELYVALRVYRILAERYEVLKCATGSVAGFSFTAHRKILTEEEILGDAPEEVQLAEAEDGFSDDAIEHDSDMPETDFTEPDEEYEDIGDGQRDSSFITGAEKQAGASYAFAATDSDAINYDLSGLIVQVEEQLEKKVASPNSIVKDNGQTTKLFDNYKMDDADFPVLDEETIEDVSHSFDVLTDSSKGGQKNPEPQADKHPEEAIMSSDASEDI